MTKDTLATTSHMSFNFKFNDEPDVHVDDGDDDDNDLDLDAFDDTGLLALASRGRAQVSVAAAFAGTSSASMSGMESSLTAGGESEGEESEELDWDNVEWEDADPGEDYVDDSLEPDNADGRDYERQKPTHEGKESSRKFPSEGVTIGFGPIIHNDNDLCDEDPNEKGEEQNEKLKSSKKRKRRTANRILRDVPLETQQLLLNVRRSDMLCHVANSIRCSQVCGGGAHIDESDCRWLLSHVALSLIPLEFHSDDFSREIKPMAEKSTETEMITPKKSNKPYFVPTQRQLQQFSRWFFQFVNHAGLRLREAIRRNISLGASVASTSPLTRRRRKERLSGSMEVCYEVGGSKLDKLQPHFSFGKKQYPRKRRRKKFEKENKNTIERAFSSVFGVEYILTGKNSTNVGKDLDRTQRSSCEDQSAANLIQKLLCLSACYVEDPQLLLEQEDEEGIDIIDVVENMTAQEKVLLFLTMVRFVLLEWLIGP